MAVSTIRRKNTFYKTLLKDDVIDIQLPQGETMILAFNHPYGATKAGLYMVTGGYTTSSAGITTILASNIVSITKITNTIVRVTVSDATYLTAIRGA